jgi:hypothetical protein
MLTLTLALAAEAAPVKIAAVTAKSSYNANGVSYPAEAVKDGKAMTPWFEGDAGSGVGSWIEVDLGGTKNVTKIAVLPGDWSGAGWSKANRPKELTLQWSDESTASWTLTDSYEVQVFTPPKPVSTAKIRLKVAQIYNGSAFPDTAISEILVWDDQVDPAFASVTAVTASSTLPSDADGSYAASQAADNVRDTYWCEGGKTGDGAGEWLEFKLDAATRLTGLSLCNGMCGSVDMLKKGNAPSRVTLQFSDGSTQAVDLKAVMPLPQTIPLTPVTTTSVKMTIDAVRAGTEFPDTCVSEVQFKK